MNPILAIKCQNAFKKAKIKLDVSVVNPADRLFRSEYLNQLKKDGETLDSQKEEAVIEYLYELSEFN